MKAWPSVAIDDDRACSPIASDAEFLCEL